MSNDCDDGCDQLEEGEKYECVVCYMVARNVM